MDPTKFGQELDNPKAKLAAALKPTIEGEYEVYVELATKPKEIEGLSKYRVFDFHHHFL